ncbi:hypothetical protein MKX03_009045 [Papaver bracteatum]|nr:hypothetical protein MKX03_009045 [Papaver bracteatum]
MDTSKLTLDIFTKLEQKWLLSNCEDKKTSILSIDGGGTKGFISGSSLIHLEDQIQERTGVPNSRISDFFDIVAGTGIVADDGEGRPLFTAKSAVKLVIEKQSEMFKVKNVGVFRRHRRYSCKNIDEVLKQTLSKDDGKVLTLKDTCKPLLIPCYDLKSSGPFVFSRADAIESDSFDFELWKVSIDGGLVMNNPTSAAVTHVLHNKRDFPSVNGVEDLYVLSLGNGPLSNPLVEKVGSNGECSIPALVDIVLDGVSETVDQMFGNAFCWNQSDYVRIQAHGIMTEKMETVTEDLLRERGVESLPFGGKRLLTETNGQRIDKFVQRLVASGRSSLPPSPCKQISVSPLVNGRNSLPPSPLKELGANPLVNGR